MVFLARSAAHSKRFVLIAAIMFLSVCPARPQVTDNLEELKKLSLEELMDVRVTSVSRRPEKLTEVASAIQVITREEILRSGATCIPEALRLVSNLQVAQLNSHAWIISARGFNAAFSNKLLVMIDGRTVYSPLFAGVFWDVQNVLLEDIERIEVISGPGGTAWGANAVNGVINIITRNASSTQGAYVSAGVGTYLRQNYAMRYGGKITPGLSYRVFGALTERDHTFRKESSGNDAWCQRFGGFGVDWQPSDVDAVIVHGNFNNGSHDNDSTRWSKMDGQNVLARWSHKFRETSTLVVQAYFDHAWRRDITSTFTDNMKTYDLDIDHNFQASEAHRIVWGLGYRFTRDETKNSTVFVGFIPKDRDMPLYSAFIQDEISMAHDRLRLILGTKLQHHFHSGLEVQPSARLAWMREHYTLWGAVSRAVRAPSRIDIDYRLPAFDVPPPIPSVAGGPDFVSEKVIACELGYRWQPSTSTFFSVSTFYNVYDDLYSVDSLPNTYTYVIQNGTEGTSHGVELYGKMQLTRDWTLRAGYTYFHKDLANKPGHKYDYSSLGYDAENIVMAQSMLNLPADLRFDVAFRYIGRLEKLDVPDYLTFDARITWTRGAFELSVVGQNLWEDRHVEVNDYSLPRSVFASITSRF